MSSILVPRELRPCGLVFRLHAVLCAPVVVDVHRFKNSCSWKETPKPAWDETSPRCRRTDVRIGVATCWCQSALSSADSMMASMGKERASSRRGCVLCVMMLMSMLGAGEVEVDGRLRSRVSQRLRIPWREGSVVSCCVSEGRMCSADDWPASQWCASRC